MRYALLIEYDGADFRGSQLQTGVRTVQSELERALGKIFEQPVRVMLASRTDSGVHATGQVGAFDAVKEMDPDTLARAINNHGPDDITVRRVRTAGDGFDPRRDATQREYMYRLNDNPVRSSLHRRMEFHVRHTLDVGAMQLAARALVGEHDFASFAGPAAPRDRSTTRRVVRATVSRNGSSVEFLISANAFIHQQIRRTTGELVRVGTGKIGPDEFEKLVETPVRGSAQSLLAPQGLCLAHIEYPDGGPLGVPSEYN